MLEVLARNNNYHAEKTALFELAKIYIPELEDPTKLPDERRQIVIGFFRDGDFYTLKGMIETLLSRAGIKNATFTADTENPHLPSWTLREDLHRGRQSPRRIRRNPPRSPEKLRDRRPRLRRRNRLRKPLRRIRSRQTLHPPAEIPGDHPRLRLRLRRFPRSRRHRRPRNEKSRRQNRRIRSNSSTSIAEPSSATAKRASPST